MATCRECGAVYEREGDGCASRFEALLALDHSRAEPWGSRHGLAFSAFALQHPERFEPAVLERAWIFLVKVYEQGDDYRRVTAALRRVGNDTPDWDVPKFPGGRPDRFFSVTITDLESFAAETYPEKLDAWCRAALAAWADR